MMLKKFSGGSIVTGVIVTVVGIWLVDASEGLWKYKYSSGMRTMLEFFQWLSLMLGVFGIIAGIFYIIQDMKPVTKVSGKLIEKNGNAVVFELEDGSRKRLTLIGNISLVVGDYGIIEYKGSFVTKFNK